MSVINNVLKDLENKPSAFTPLDLQDVVTSKTSNKSQHSGAIIVLLILLSLVVIYIAQSSSSILWNDEPSVMILPEAEPSLVQEAKLKVTPALKSAPKLRESIQPSTLGAGVIRPIVETERLIEITGMQIKETMGFLELKLHLSMQTQSYLKQRSQNKYIFYISKSINKIKAPLIEHNPWLTKLNFVQKEAGVEVQLNTVPGVLVETNHKMIDQKYFWIVRLKKNIQDLSENNISSPLSSQAGVKFANPEIPLEQNVEASEVALGKAKLEIQKPVVKLSIKPATTINPTQIIFDSAIDAMHNKNWTLAVEQFEGLMSTDRDKDARLNLIRIYQLQRKSGVVTRLISKSAQLYPDDIDFKVLDAQQLFEKKSYVTLISRYQDGIQNLSLITLLSASYQRLGRHDRAIQYYQKALKIDPQQAKSWISMGISQEHQKMFDAATSSYKMALRIGVMNARLEAFTQRRIKKLTGR